METIIPKCFLKNVNTLLKKKKMPKYITEDIEIFYDKSDKGNSDKKNSHEKNSDEENHC